MNIWSLRVLEIGGADLTLLETLPIVAAVVLGAILLRRMYAERREEPPANAALEAQLAQIAEANTALEARLAALAQTSTNSHDTLRKTVDERLESVAKRLGEGLNESHKRTSDSLTKLYERLSLIDQAQKNIETLSGEVSGLQALLSNKQSRGAFGEIQMADIVANFMPPKSYDFQVKLSNDSRVDCLIILPNPPGPVAVDAKFPLEDWRAYAEAEDQASRDTAARGFKAAVIKHVKDIASKYLIPGETADTALMFLPSEAVYATLHAEFPDVVEAGFKARVMIVSPTTFMATLHTMRAVMRDAQMREQAHVIQKEVALLGEDVVRLDDRVGKLQRHFDQASEDVRQIRISTEKVKNRSDRIIEAELEDGDVELAPAAQPKRLSVVE
ncbi:MAG: DNA recombination protein RmuC [Maricaulaceae bacterium]